MSCIAQLIIFILFFERSRQVGGMVEQGARVLKQACDGMVFKCSKCVYNVILLPIKVS